MSVSREDASARRARLYTPWLGRLATLGVLVLVVATLTPPSGQAAFQPAPAALYPATVLAASQMAQPEPTPTVTRDPRDLPLDEYHPHPLRRVHRVTAYCDRGLTAA